MDFPVCCRFAKQNVESILCQILKFPKAMSFIKFETKNTSWKVHIIYLYYELHRELFAKISLCKLTCLNERNICDVRGKCLVERVITRWEIPLIRRPSKRALSQPSKSKPPHILTLISSL